MFDNVPVVFGIEVATIIAVVLGIAAVVVYYKGARPEKPWGTPLLVLLVLGCVVALIVERMDIGQGMRRRRLRYQSQRLIGEGLKDKLSDGARVIIFRQPVDREMMPEEEMPDPPEDEEMPDIPTVEEQVEEMQKNWEEAIEEGAGVDIEVVACVTPNLSDEELEMMMGPEYPGDARAFSDVLEEYRDQDIDAWISFVGVPRTMDGDWDLQNVSSHDWSNAPLVAAEMGVYYEPEVLRGWIDDGLLDAASIHPSTRKPEMKVITADTLEDLPDEPPVEMGPPPEGGR